MVPSTVVCPREGSVPLPSLGRVRKDQVKDSLLRESAFAIAFGRRRVARKRIVEAI
jgi:hypothetical protein